MMSSTSFQPPSSHPPTPNKTDDRKINYGLADVRVVLRGEDDAIKCLKRITHRIIEELDLRPPKAKMWEVRPRTHPPTYLLIPLDRLLFLHPPTHPPTHPPIHRRRGIR